MGANFIVIPIQYYFSVGVYFCRPEGMAISVTCHQCGRYLAYSAYFFSEHSAQHIVIRTLVMQKKLKFAVACYCQ